MVMIGYWVYKFKAEDRDIGVVDYVSIEESADIELPVASLCFMNPFIGDALKKLYPEELHPWTYLDHLKGDAFDERVNNIDYSNVTINLDDFLSYGYGQMRNETDFRHEPFVNREHFNGISEWNFFEKCFEITSTKSPHYFNQIFVGYNLTSLFENIGSDSLSFSVVLHYPGQYLLRVTLPDDIDHNNKDRNLILNVEDIEIMKSRNSRNRKCTPYNDDKSFDDMVLEAHIDRTGCNVPYLRSVKDFAKCSTKERVKKSLYDYKTARKIYYPVSCQRLSKIVYEVDNSEETYKQNEDLTWQLTIMYPDYFRIITQSKEVDIHALIGNIGGYIGLFLGNTFDE